MFVKIPRGRIRMYTIAIIDDEVLAIKCLVKILERYDKYPLHIITALSGEEALLKLGNIYPDILLVDIEMQGMDGFSLINEIHARYNSMAKAIMVTGYNQFDYCKRAFGIHAVDFILKPVKTSELYTALDNAIEDLETSKRTSQDMTLFRDNYNVRILNDYLMGKKGEVVGSEDTHEILKYLNQPYFFCTVLRILGIQNVCEKTRFQLTKYINTICEKYPEKHLRIMCLEISTVEFVVVGSIQECMDMNIIISDIHKQFDAITHHYSIGVTEPFTCFMDIKEHYEKALFAARQHLLARPGTQRNIYYAITRKEDEYFNPLSYQREVVEIIQLVSLGSYEANHRIRALFNPQRFQHFQSFRETLLGLLIRIQQLGYETGVMLEPLQDLENVLSISENIEEIVLWLVKQSEKIVFKIQMEKSSGSYRSIQRVIEYVQMHYMDNLSLDFVASKASVNSAYFCVVFKKITGKTYIEYLTKLRIEKAKHLMADGDFNITELGAKVGYEDSNYFGRVFIKNTGMSPNQYRKGLQ